MSMTSGCSDEKLLCFIAFSTRSCNTAGGRKPLHCLTPGLTFAMTPSSWRTFIKYKYESRNLISSATGIRFRSKLVMMYRYTFDRLLRNFPASPVEISESYSAAIRGRQDVDILPQISGRIIRLKVKEGERVKTGQVLAVIDQVPYRAALRTAQANVSAAQAKVETARIELRGKQALFDEKVISDYELSLARNQLAVACAELEQAKAQESDARNNLSYTEIKSPSNGVVGTLPYRIGALVGPNMAQPFTVVSDNAEMYAYFSISENMLRRYSARYGSIDSMIAGTPEVGLQLNDGSLYKAKGRIETVSGVVDPVTGTVQIKALFPNPDRELLSGSIGNVILQNPKTEAVTIPMTATVELQDKIIAYRLKNGQAEAAYLTVDRLNDGNRFIVKEGLSVGDTIVAEGVGLVREGMSITPKNETK